MKKETIVEIIAAFFILLFAYTAINKFMVITDLKIVLHKYPLIGGASFFVAWALPLVESIITLLLFIPKFRLLGLYGSLILMSAFTLYLIFMLGFTSELPCTCGGMLQKMTWPQHLTFNFLSVLLAIAAIWLRKKQSVKKQESAPIVFT